MSCYYSTHSTNLFTSLHCLFIFLNNVGRRTSYVALALALALATLHSNVQRTAWHLTSDTCTRHLRGSKSGFGQGHQITVVLTPYWVHSIDCATAISLKYITQLDLINLDWATHKCKKYCLEIDNIYNVFCTDGQLLSPESLEKSDKELVLYRPVNQSRHMSKNDS